MSNEESEVEICQVCEAEDFGENITPELREKEERLPAEIERMNRLTASSDAV